MNDYSRMTDEEVVVAYQGGDLDAFDYICEKYRGLISKYAKQLFIKGGEEQDVTQEGMVGLFKAIRDYDVATEVPFYSFANLCIKRQIYKAMEYADTKKQQPLNSYVSIFSEDDEKPNTEVEESMFTDDIFNPENIFIDSEKTMIIFEKIVHNLSKMELEVFMLMMQGLNYHDIADRLGKEEKNIDNAIQRIRQKVKKLLL